MNTFSISDLQQFSGIKAHTIRIWEQRYNALQPDRTEGNARFYNGSQLRRLLNIVSLLDQYKVSQLCAMDDSELHALLQGQLIKEQPSEKAYSQFVSQIIASALTYDEADFNRLFAQASKRYSLKEIYLHILYPVMVRLGLMWASDTLRPAHEHFITHLFHQKLFSAIDKLKLPAGVQTSWLLFLPGEEFHETGLLFANFLIRQQGHKVTYLGADVSIDTLKTTVDHVDPTHLLCFLVRKKDTETDASYLHDLSKLFKGKKILIACDQDRIKGMRLPANCRTLHSVDDLEREISGSPHQN